MEFDLHPPTPTPYTLMSQCSVREQLFNLNAIGKKSQSTEKPSRKENLASFRLRNSVDGSGSALRREETGEKRL